MDVWVHGCMDDVLFSADNFFFVHLSAISSQLSVIVSLQDS